MKIFIKDAVALQKIMIEKGFSQRGLGRAAGISEVYAHQIISGISNPAPKTAKKVCDALGVPFDTIFFIKDVCKSKQDSLKSKAV